jgi:hypothetical protein
MKNHLLRICIILLSVCCLFISCTGKNVQEEKKVVTSEFYANLFNIPRMGEIVNVYRQEIPALRFIGKKYGNSDRHNGMFGRSWDEWGRNGWFDIIKSQTDIEMKYFFDDGDAEVGLLRYNKNGEFEYWIGLFMPENTPVPNGFEYYDFPKGALGVCWLYGRRNEVFFQDEKCREKLEELGFEILKDKEDTIWSIERFVSDRFEEPDEKGKVTLDICFFVK